MSLIDEQTELDSQNYESKLINNYISIFGLVYHLTNHEKFNL